MDQARLRSRSLVVIAAECLLEQVEALYRSRVSLLIASALRGPRRLSLF
jgi:hypothetical protein